LGGVGFGYRSGCKEPLKGTMFSREVLRTNNGGNRGNSQDTQKGGVKKRGSQLFLSDTRKVV